MVPSAYMRRVVVPYISTHLRQSNYCYLLLKGLTLTPTLTLIYVMVRL